MYISVQDIMMQNKFNLFQPNKHVYSFYCKDKNFKFFFTK